MLACCQLNGEREIWNKGARRPFTHGATNAGGRTAQQSEGYKHRKTRSKIHVHGNAPLMSYPTRLCSSRTTYHSVHFDISLLQVHFIAAAIPFSPGTCVDSIPNTCLTKRATPNTSFLGLARATRHRYAPRRHATRGRQGRQPGTRWVGTLCDEKHVSPL